ncbi:MAG: hypothetical protein ABW196_03105 [Solirubrobacterales bacterium]
MEAIELRGGPLDGRSALQGQGAPPNALKLWHAPEPPNDDLDKPVPLSVCVYAFKGNGLYEFQRAETEMLPGSSYAILKSGEAALGTVRSVVCDKRLFSAEVPSVLPAEGGTPLPLTEARELQSTAIRNFRQARAKEGDSMVANLPEEKLWAFMCGAVLTDLEWAGIGSPLHLKGMFEVATTIFDLQIHPD